MFRRERSIPLRGSAAALCNNLSVLQQRNLTHFGVVHGPSAQLLSAAPEGVPLAQRQLHAKEGAGVSSPLITQVHWCVLPDRVLLVLASHRGIQMYESDGSVMVYWHALDSGDASLVQAVFARGIAASGHFICVGEGAEGRAFQGSPHRSDEELLTPDTSHRHCHEPAQGQLLSAAEDTFVHIWKLSRSPESGYIEVEHCHGACVPDTQVCGARFCDPSGSSFAVTGYDLAEILRFSSM
ncbi:WD repeat-containing protein 54 [Camelus dromedarius]|uniref:WD repeat-containing protein 54 n=1 Tax=Camelus dromedarius TaxID=9838 RepID=A0A5N4D790_CAMDR|nr:WD repeat-containing protein 54 [Camelus dromedarius]